MSAPRQVLPHSTYLITRRCARRQLLIRPSALINQIFLYCIAYAAKRTGVICHAAAVISNHIHVVLSDPEGKLPEFMHWLFEHTAKCVNASLGRWENLWSSEPPSAVRLETMEDIVDKIQYVWGNPAAAALVSKAADWPGVITGPEDYLKGPVEIERPKIFFRENGPTPPSVKLDIVPPPGIQGSTEDFAAMMAEELELREWDIRHQHRLAGRPIMGKKAILAQDPFEYPAGLEPRRNLNPRIAAKDKWRRIEAIGRLKEFLAAYREAWEEFKQGNRDVLFPVGSYWVVKHAGAACVLPE